MLLRKGCQRWHDESTGKWAKRLDSIGWSTKVEPNADLKFQT